jgi:hypothetical protein
MSSIIAQFSKLLLERFLNNENLAKAIAAISKNDVV